MEGKIKFVPAGGLANRMRAMASMVALAGEVQKELEVVWFRDWALHAPFKGLFEPCVIPFVQIKEARLMDLFLSDRPRKKNFWFPKYYQQWYFRHCLYEHQIDALRKGNFDFVKWASTSKRVYMASYLSAMGLQICIHYRIRRRYMVLITVLFPSWLQNLEIFHWRL